MTIKRYLYGTATAAMMLAMTAEANPDSTALMRTAMEFVSRASSTSEVLTLNLTNMLILLFLKAVIFAFTLFSFGSTASARSSDGNSLVPSFGKSDLTGGMCFMMFAAGDDEKLTCVQRSACEDPKTAQEYLTAAKMWYKMHKLLKVVPFQPKYFDVMRALETARGHSESGGDCSVYRW